EKEQRVELEHYLLNRHRLPHGIRFDTVETAGMSYAEGFVEVDVTPLGLMEPVAAVLVDEQNTALTVKWDAMTGLAHVEDGRQTVLPQLDEDGNPIPDNAMFPR